jgi:hypothetical protein
MEIVTVIASAPMSGTASPGASPTDAEVLFFRCCSTTATATNTAREPAATPASAAVELTFFVRTASNLPTTPILAALAFPMPMPLGEGAGADTDTDTDVPLPMPIAPPADRPGDRAKDGASVVEVVLVVSALLPRRDLSSSQPSVIQASSPTVAISAGFVVDFTVIPA